MRDRQISAEHAIDVVVPDSEHFGKVQAKQAHHDAAHRGLHPNRPSWEAAEPEAEPEEQLDECHGTEAAGDSEHGVDQKFHGVDQLIGRDVEQRLIAEDQMQQHP